MSMLTNDTEEARQLERIPTRVFPASEEACRELAEEIATLIRSRAKESRPAVLGLATGSTPVRLYRELVRLHREEGLSFANVVTFNLDEYFGLEPSHPESYHRFMREQLFDHVDIPEEQTHIPRGTVERAKVFEHCAEYESAIRDAGGIDFQILGIGRTGHIGFNEPGSSRESRTRLITLDSTTRRDAARDFLGEGNVPRYAITMGIGTILEARKVVLLAWGASKAPVIAKAVEGPACESLPASFLQGHREARFILDESAASTLTRFSHPWLVQPVAWNAALTRKAVTWLAEKVEKPFLRLIDEDYQENGMGDLLTQSGPAYDLNIHIFNVTQHTITGWPGGKPEADDSNRPERATPHPKKVLVLSPEPIDDCLCMGGTLHRLARQGHEVTVAYATSGNLAVPDLEVRRLLDVFEGDGSRNEQAGKTARSLKEYFDRKGPFDLDPGEVRKFKGLIRRGEARSAARVLGLHPDTLRFLDLPFYEKGRYRRFQLQESDIEGVRQLLDELRPHQIFTTGLENDPTSIQAIAFEALTAALRTFDKEDWLKDCYTWLFRGPEREWEVDQIDMAVPLSPAELGIKVQAVYQHQSQRSQSPSPQKGTQDAWHSAAELNRKSAELYDALGMAEYEAIEGFKRWEIQA